MQEISGKAKVYGLLAYPTGHSLSPLLHNTLAGQLHLDMVYVPFPAAPQNLEAALWGAHALGIQGLNVSVPYKEKVRAHLVQEDELARGTGAVNTLVWTPDGYEGHNTDVTGLYKSIVQAGVKLEGGEAVVLGAGGAARAAVMMLLTYGAAQVYVVNRTLAKAEKLKADLIPFAGNTRLDVLSSDCLSQIPGYGTSSHRYLVIQTTSVGMSPQAERCPVEDPAFFELTGWGVDIVFNPLKTVFLQKVEEAGGVPISGLRMLLYQGIAAFGFWNPDVTIDRDLEEEVYLRMERRLGYGG